VCVCVCECVCPVAILTLDLRADTWTLLCTLETERVAGWHTVTYHALEQHGTRLVCGTENGSVILIPDTSPVVRVTFI